MTNINTLKNKTVKTCKVDKKRHEIVFKTDDKKQYKIKCKTGNCCFHTLFKHTGKTTDMKNAKIKNVSYSKSIMEIYSHYKEYMHVFAVETDKGLFKFLYESSSKNGNDMVVETR